MEGGGPDTDRIHWYRCIDLAGWSLQRRSQLLGHVIWIRSTRAVLKPNIQFKFSARQCDQRAGHHVSVEAVLKEKALEDKWTFHISRIDCDRGCVSHHPGIKPASSGQRKLRRSHNYSAFHRRGRQSLLLLDRRGVLFRAFTRDNSYHLQPRSERSSRSDGGVHYPDTGSVATARRQAGGATAVFDSLVFRWTRFDH